MGKIIPENEMNEWQLSIVNFYCENDMKELKKICKPLIRKKEEVTYMDYDDLYSCAMWTLLESVCSFSKDANCKFKTFLIGNIKREFYSWTRDMERECRCNLLRENGKVVVDDVTGRPVRVDNISFDMENNNEDYSLKDLIASDFSLEDEAEKLLDEPDMDSKVEKYLNSLPLLQRKVAKLLYCGYTNAEIMEDLHLTKKEFKSNLEGLRVYEKVKILF